MRDEGYTLVAKNVFKNAEDMKYFDEDDPEHNELKKFIHGKATGMTNCVFTPEVSVNL